MHQGSVDPIVRRGSAFVQRRWFDGNYEYFHVAGTATVPGGVEQHAREVTVGGGVRFILVAVDVGLHAGNGTDVRVGVQADGKHATVRPFQVGQALRRGRPEMFAIGGHQHPAGLGVGLAGNVEGHGGPVDVGVEQRGALAVLEVDHEDLTLVALVVEQYIHVLHQLVEGNVGVLRFAVQLQVLTTDVAVVGCLEGAVVGTGTGSGVVRDGAITAGGGSC